MIGPLFRSPVRGPRSEPLRIDVGRRARNLFGAFVELVTAPLGFWRLQRLEVVTVEIGIRGLAPAFDGYRIAYLSDLHKSAIVPRWWLEQAVRSALEARPDLIALGGDFVHDDVHYAPGLAELLAPLAAPDGVVAVLGNHDHYIGPQHVRDALHSAGIVELLNVARVLQRGDARLAIAGLGDLQCDVIDFTAAVGSVPQNVPRIVLSHDPDVFAYWPVEHRLDLMISGHTHGGQAYLPILGPPFVPSQFGFRYLKGLVREGGRQLYVSRGVGASGVPFRWGCPAELTVIILRPS